MKNYLGPIQGEGLAALDLINTENKYGKLFDNLRNVCEQVGKAVAAGMYANHIYNNFPIKGNVMVNKLAALERELAKIPEGQS